MIKLGLIGFPLGHSFSKKYYQEKFKREGIVNIDYDLYSLEDIQGIRDLFMNDTAFKGFNITIPHKVNIMSFLHELSEEAQVIGAVNCITIQRNDQNSPILKGYNTDAYGFEQSLLPLLTKGHTKALVLGNGGAAKAVIYTLQKLNLPYLLVSRSKNTGDITYEELTPEIMHTHQIVINCSPVGTFPNIDQSPNLPYHAITKHHLLYDLIYNPEETQFLKNGKSQGAQIKNGYEMLVLQAEKNWEIWKGSF